LIIAGAIILNLFYEDLSEKLLFLKEKIFFLFNAIVNNYFIQIAMIFLLGILLSYILQRVYFKIKIKRKIIAEEKIYVQNFMEEDLNSIDLPNLEFKLKEIKKKYLLERYPELNFKIEEIKNLILKLEHKEHLNNFYYQKRIVKKEIIDLELERDKLKITEKQKIALLKKNLNLEENKIFAKYDLDSKEVKILLEEGYKQVNEYCVSQKCVIVVLIRPTLNHSVAHTFLVWSTRKLLEKYGTIENIIEHETKDADLTFQIDSKTFAIEIETGTLLRKKKQLLEKIKFLNKKYKNKWMIVVSKRNLVKKYRRFGLCTQRNGVSEKLEKMAKI